MTQFDKVWNYYLTAKTSDERNAALISLGCSANSEVIEKTLHVFFSDEVKNQDAESPLLGLRDCAVGIEALFKFATENWDHVCKRFPPGLSTLGRFINNSATGFTKREQLARVEAFYGKMDTKGFDKNIEQAKDSIQSNISWVERDAEDVSEWLRAKGYIS